MNTSIITYVGGRAVPVRGDDIDTDRIIPARYLRTLTFEDLGTHAFEDDRAQGKHAFDEPRFQGSAILLANRNFGCGSSREHAPQALMRWGIRAFVAESFAEIFFGNCVALGLPCFTAPGPELARLMDSVEAAPLQKLGLDVERQLLSWKGGETAIALPEGARRQFLEGTWDALGQLLEAPDLIRATAERLPYLNDFAAAT
ncbi:MAG: 3-isopropylmalate dehydratase small subunit [Candidatus Latescibacteria bacterium]|nr:3-isopropylmalate dehydratase small subunit [Candidatus Latescibacterota bacterium]